MLKLKQILVTGAVLLLGACASFPEKLRVSEGTILAKYTDVLADPEGHFNYQARWGGVIADIKNFEDKTRLEVVHFKLSSTGKPKASDNSPGRYRVYVSGFLEPSIYQKGRLVSFLGTVDDSELGLLDEREINYPVLRSESAFLWPKAEPIKKVYVHSQHWRYSHPWHWYSPRAILIKKNKRK